MPWELTSTVACSVAFVAVLTTADPSPLEDVVAAGAAAA
jgi:hypothetical protein